MKTKQLILVFALFTTFLVGCDYLDTLPPNVLTEETVFSNESSVNAYLAKLYSDILIEDSRMNSSNYNNEHTYLQLEYYTGYSMPSPGGDILDNQGQGINGNIGFSWFNYNAIRNVNDFLVNIEKYADKLDSKKVTNWIAEAHTIRAWYYFSMAKRYGGLPIITKPQEVIGASSESLMVARSSEKETWDFILSDLDFALNNGLNNSNGNGRIDKYVAFMLKAQSALYAASIARYSTSLTPEISNYKDINTGKQLCGIPAENAIEYYNIAYAAADSIIVSNKYALAKDLDANGSTNFARLFINPDSHKESLLVKYFKNPTIGHRWDYWHLPKPFGTGEYDNPTLNLVDLYDNLDGTSAAVLTGADGFVAKTYSTPSEMFEGRDYRLGGTVYYPGSYLGDVKMDIRKGVIVNNELKIAVGNTTIDGVSYSNRGLYGMGDLQQTSTGFYCRKYIDENNFKNVSFTLLNDHPWIIMRYAEALLIAAECAVELNDHKDVGKKAIDDIRVRAGLPKLASENDLTISEVRKQWVCEFAFENVVFWNMRRWRTLDQTLTNSFKSTGLEPYWDLTNNSWKFKKVSIGFPKITFLNKYYYNQIDAKAISTNPKIIQNYGY